MNRRPRSAIYVETTIARPLDDVWAPTQRPSLHERWDLRFTTIEYTSRDEATSRQQFRYATRIGFGVEIAGTGESIASTELRNGARVSSLSFRSDDRRSLILENSDVVLIELPAR